MFSVRAVAVLSLATLTGCPFALPPLRNEIGPAWSGNGGTFRAATGVDLIGVGAKTSRISAGAGAFIEMPVQAEVPTVETPVEPLPNTTGTYGELGYEAYRSTHTRVMVGVRGERRNREGVAGYAAKLRLDVEAFGRGSGPWDFSEGCAFGAGLAHGIGGIGLYAESGPVHTPGDVGWATTVGLSVRTPAIVGFVFGLPCGK